MADWDDRFRDAQVGESAQQLRGLIAESLETLPEDQRQALERLDTVLARVESVVASVDPLLVSQSMIDTIKKPITAASTALDSYKAAPEQARLAPALSAADGVINALRGWPTDGPELDVAELRGEVASVRRSARTTKTEIQKRTEEAETRLAELESHTDQERDRVSGDWAAQLEQTRSTLDERLTQLTERIETQEPRLDEAIAEFQAQFSAAQAERQSKADEALATHGAAHEALLGEQTTEFERAISERSETADADLAKMKEHRDEVETLVGIIARTGMAGGYETRADREERSARNWRLTAFTLGLLAVAVLVLFAAFSDGATTENVISRVALSGSIGGVATYAARQANRHREASEDARAKQLALASIGPYLEPLDVDARSTLLEAFAFVFFGPSLGRGGSADSKSEDAIGIQNLLQIVTSILQRQRPGTAPESDST